MKDLRLEKLANILVNYSTNIKSGDKVYISAEYSCVDFIKVVSKEAVKAGGIVEYFADIPEIEAEILKNGNNNQIQVPNERFGTCIKGDVWISAWGTNNVYNFKNINHEILKSKRLANSENRKTYGERSASGKLRWCGTQFPTNADAQSAKMSLEEYEDFVYNAGFLQFDDPVCKWKELSDFHEKWIKYLNQKKELHILSKDTDIYVGIEGRKWINCCGKENFPDGEIFTSPIENKINGNITFSLPAIINGNEFEKVHLEVEDGRIQKASCLDKNLNERLLSYIDTDEGSRYFGEVAIGTNYEIKRFTKNILFDEKIGGTMHMAIGAAMAEAGGKNISSIHWDMINEMSDGEIYADGEIFYKNGKFIETVLK